MSNSSENVFREGKMPHFPLVVGDPMHNKQSCLYVNMSIITWNKFFQLNKIQVATLIKKSNFFNFFFFNKFSKYLDKIYFTSIAFDQIKYFV